TEMPARVIFVASSITPDVLPLIKQVVGIVTEQGGMTSHGAILARELGIPAVTGVRNATQYIRSGERLWLDGNQGEVQRVGLHRSGTEVQPQLTDDQRIDDQLTDAQRTDAQRTDAHDSQPAAFPPAAAPSPLISPPIATQLFVTLSQPDAIARVAHLPVDGVGLVRSELMLLEVLEQRHPQMWIEQGQQAELVDRITRQMQRFAEAFFPRPVYYRSADWRSHEFSYLQGMITVAEPNPMLGLRGTLSYQYHPAWFEVELAALRQIQQNGYSNLHLILPFVRTVEEFCFCRQQVERMGLFQQPQFQLWIMAEVPSVLLLLPDYVAAGAQGIAIGSNDLTQLLLGIDRDQPALANVFNANHPAVMRAIHQLIQMAHTAQIPCSICGLATKPSLDLINRLVQWGITAISVEPGEVEQTYGAIVRAERQLLIAAARQWAGSDE
ncbi:MAG TPA: putative PEP-binding protein, partial [Allocoleopsis sp.]